MFSYSPLNAHFFTKPANTSSANEQGKSEFLKIHDLAEYFFISHPSSGQKEGSEQKRIMFFYPSDEPISKQTEVTGMAEAVVNFTSGLNGPNDVHCSEDQCNFRYITSTNSKEVVLVVEDGEFLLGTSFNRRKCRANNYFPHLPTICSLLSNIYNSYKLFYGSFSSRWRLDESNFKEDLHRFFIPYLQLYRVNKVPLIDLFNGVDFLSLDSLNFLEIDCLMASCMQEFPYVKKAIFFYQERLVQYTVNKRDLPSICQFLNQTLISSAIQAEVSPPLATKRGSTNSSVHNGFLISGPMLVDYLGELTDHLFPKVFLHDSDLDESLFAYELIAYRVRSATACFFVEPGIPDDRFSEFIDSLTDFIDDRITEITSRMGNDPPKSVQSDILYHFIYFNSDSLSLRKSFPSFAVPNQDTTVENHLPPSNIYRLVYETYDRFMMGNSNLFGQIFLKADNDWWIVFKRVERRILVLFISQTVASTIVDIEHYVDNIVKSGRFKILFIP